jgi:hypothetical protein
MAKVYTESFKKTDGTVRKMKFVRLNELNENDYVTYGIPTVRSESVRNHSDGCETVWDLDKGAFRTFNWSKVIKG